MTRTLATSSFIKPSRGLNWPSLRLIVKTTPRRTASPIGSPTSPPGGGSPSHHPQEPTQMKVFSSRHRARGWRPGLELLEDRTTPSASLIADINPATLSADPAQFADVNGTLF